MITITLSLDSMFFYLVIFDVLAILFYTLYIFHKKRKLVVNENKIVEFVQGYFLSNGVDAKVKCFQMPDDKKITTLIESEQLKRLRYSSVLESSLMKHIHRLTGTEVEKIYWRFTIQNATNLKVTDENMDTDLTDDDSILIDPYLKEKHLEQYTVSETTWDEYTLEKE